MAGLDAGVYLIEATDGTYKAYTVAIVTKIAVVERTENGQAALYVADRKTGAPVDKADVVLWADRKTAVVGQDRQRRPGIAHYDGARRRTGSGAGKCVDPGAPRSRRRAGDAVGLRTSARRTSSRSALTSIRTGPFTGPATRCTSRQLCARN